MIDLAQYPCGTVLLVKCYDGGAGHVIIQGDVSDDNIKLVRELGCVADLHPDGAVKKILGDTADGSTEWYNVVKIEAVLDGVKTTTIHNPQPEEPCCIPPQEYDRFSPSECSETNPVVKELIGAMTQQFAMVVGVLEKFSQAE